MLKVSSIMGMDIYGDKAQFIGKVYDVIIDLQKGEIVRLTLEPIRASSKEDAKRIFKEKTVLYKSVKAVEKIIIASEIAGAMDEEVETEPEPAKPMPYSYKYRKY